MAKGHALVNVLGAVLTANETKGLVVKVYGQDGLLELTKQTVSANAPGTFGSRFGLAINGKTIIGTRSDSQGAYKVIGTQPIDEKMNGKYCRFRPSDIAALIYTRCDNQGIIESPVIAEPTVKPANVKVKRTSKASAKKTA